MNSDTEKIKNYLLNHMINPKNIQLMYEFSPYSSDSDRIYKCDNNYISIKKNAINEITKEDAYTLIKQYKQIAFENKKIRLAQILLDNGFDIIDKHELYNLKYVMSNISYYDIDKWFTTGKIEN